MPAKTRMLEYGNFVYSPQSPANPAFSQYLDFADRLLGQWREVQEEWTRSRFAPEVGERKKDLDQAVSSFVDSFRGRYTIKSVEQDPTFLPVSRFFAQYRPLREPFSILHCNLEMPLHTVLEFQTHRDLASVNAALDEDTPLPWWQSGPHHRPCYLFGEWVWELKASEITQSEEGLALLFLEISEKSQQKLDRLGSGYSQITAAAEADFIPQHVRVAVWRRSRGKCAKCGGHEGLDFEFIRPGARGTDPNPKNIQLLCRNCQGQKSGILSR